MGAGHLTHLSLLHPRLLHSLVLIDPVFSLRPAGVSWAAASAARRDFWPMRSVAESKFRSNRAFQSWDPRVLNQYIAHGLRALPTEKYPTLPEEIDPQDPPVTLQTTKAQEQYNYIRAAYQDDRYLLADPENDRWSDYWPEDLDAERGPFGRFENKILFRKLPELRPSVLYLLGGKSEVAGLQLRQERLKSTGTGAGGSGGEKKGRVKEVLLDCGHLVPFEATTAAAEACAEFVDGELVRWEMEDGERRRKWEKLNRRERVDLNELWIENIGANRKKKDGNGQGKPPEKL